MSFSKLEFLAGISIDLINILREWSIDWLLFEYFDSGKSGAIAWIKVLQLWRGYKMPKHFVPSSKPIKRAYALSMKWAHYYRFDATLVDQAGRLHHNQHESGIEDILIPTPIRQTLFDAAYICCWWGHVSFVLVFQ